MLKFNRFFYGIIFSSIITWTIYILTVDFYALTLLSYGPQSMTNGPIPVKWIQFFSLIPINFLTLVILIFAIFLSKLKCQKLFD